MKQSLSHLELLTLIKKADLSVNQIIRTQEPYYKQNIKGKNLSVEELITAIVNNPKLLCRPLVETKTKAVLAIPPERIDQIL